MTVKYYLKPATPFGAKHYEVINGLGYFFEFFDICSSEDDFPVGCLKINPDNSYDMVLDTSVSEEGLEFLKKEAHIRRKTQEHALPSFPRNYLTWSRILKIGRKYETILT